MTGPLPRAQLSPPAQPKRKQIIVFKRDPSSVNFVHVAKAMLIVDKASPVSIVWPDSFTCDASVCCSLLSLELVEALW